MLEYCDVFQRIILKRTSTEVYVNMRRHQGAKSKLFDVSDVIYHKFLHDAASYALNWGKHLRHVRILYQGFNNVFNALYFKQPIFYL